MNATAAAAAAAAADALAGAAAAGAPILPNATAALENATVEALHALDTVAVPASHAAAVYLARAANALWAVAAILPYATEVSSVVAAFLESVHSILLAAASAGHDLVHWFEVLAVPAVSVLTPLVRRITDPLRALSATYEFFAVVNGAKMLAVSLAIMYVAAHGALRRPPSARAPVPKKKSKTPPPEIVVGLGLADVIVMPLVASVFLISMYYALQYLDPSWINAFLRYYFSLIAVSSMALFNSHALGVAASFVFPTFCRDRRGMLWRAVDSGVVDGSSGAAGESAAAAVAAAATAATTTTATTTAADAPPAAAPRHRAAVQGWKPVWETRYQDERVEHGSALWWRSVGMAGRERFWALRRLVLRQCTLEAGAGGPGGPDVTHFRLSTLAALLAAIGVSTGYAHMGAAWMSNMISLGTCYGGLVFMSPTSFRIGTFFLSAFLVYDIIMVFFTPYMLGVATAVDAPMVLTFETETPMGGGGETSVHKSMLGLGDILFPGLLTVFALRFDLHLHWAAKMRVEQLAQRVAGGSGAAVGPEAPVGAEAAVGPPAAAGTTPPPATTPPSTPAAALPRAIRATFVPPSGLWGDRAIEAAWHVLARLGYNDATSPFVGRRLLPRRMRETLFAKRYFWAAMAGYAVGLAITIAVMITWHHGQPALFYLVPCVLSSQWLLAWWRGELAMLWAYTEDGSLDVEGVLVEVDEAGHKILRAPTRAGVVEGAATQADEKKDEKDDNKDDRDHKTQDGDASAKAADARVLFHLRLLAPEGDDEDEDDGGFEEYEVLKDAATTGSAAAGGAAAAGDGPDDGDARDAHDAAAASGASSSDWSISEGELED